MNSPDEWISLADAASLIASIAYPGQSKRGAIDRVRKRIRYCVEKSPTSLQFHREKGETRFARAGLLEWAGHVWPAVAKHFNMALIPPTPAPSALARSKPRTLEGGATAGSASAGGILMRGPESLERWKTLAMQMHGALRNCKAELEIEMQLRIRFEAAFTKLHRKTQERADKARAAGRKGGRPKKV